MLSSEFPASERLSIPLLDRPGTRVRRPVIVPFGILCNVCSGLSALLSWLPADFFCDPRHEDHRDRESVTTDFTRGYMTHVQAHMMPKLTSETLCASTH
jgi:hypothetical protein